MYVVGGFDGSRLNDMFHIALEKVHENSDSSDVISQSMLPMHNLNVSSRNGGGQQQHLRVVATPTSAASGIMQTVPSDLSIS